MRLKTTLLWFWCIVFYANTQDLHAQQDSLINPLISLAANCDQPPLIICPPDFETCPGASTDPANTGYASGLPSSPICSPPVIRFSDSTISMQGCPGSVHIIRTWIATDPQVPTLTATCTQNIILADTTPPLILDCPGDTTVAPNGKCFANVFWDQPLVLDDCGKLDLDVTHISGDRYPLGETVVTYTATDACGNVSQCSFTITVEGDCCDLPPIITCPGDYAGCPGDTILPKKIGRARALPGRANCDAPAVFYNDDTISTGPCKGGVVIERTWTAVDPHDPSLTAQCVQSIVLKDEILPFIFGCPANITVDSDKDCKAIVSWAPPTARDNCLDVKLESNFVPGDTFQIGTTTIIYVATDSCGNRRTCTFDVEVKKACCDDDPLIFCPSDYYGCPGTSVDTSITGVATAEPGGPFCEEPTVRFEDSVISEGPCPGARKIKRLWIAQDPHNPDLRSTCTQIITLEDTIAPVLVMCTADTSLSPNTECKAVVSWSPPQFTDNCGGVILTSTHAPGDTFDIGNTTVTYTATDSCGNSATCSFVITVLDDCCNKPPMITCAADFSDCIGADINPDITGRPRVQKGNPQCNDPIVTFVNDTVSTGPCTGAYVIIRRWTATDPDDSTLVASCDQKITIDDVEKPELTNCPSDTTISPNVDCEAVFFWNRPGVKDNCGIRSVTSTHMPGDTFQIGTTTVTYTLTDLCGNTATCSFEIKVKDECCNKPPTITCPTDFSGCPGADIHPDFTGRPIARKGTPFCNDPVVTYVDDTITQGPCAGAIEVSRTWTATDPIKPQLNASCTQTITLNDTIKPELTNCPADTSLAPNDECEAVVVWNRPGIRDNCGIRSVSSTHMPGDTFPVGTTTVTYTLTDICGNTATCSFEITVRDECCNKPPSVFCPATFEGCPGVMTDPSITGMASAAKGHPSCDDPIITFEDDVLSSGPCMGAQVIRRSWIATDPNDSTLADTCHQMITLEDTIAPTISNCPGDTTLSPNMDCEARVMWPMVSVDDNCGTPMISSTHQSGDLFPIGQTTVTITATDGCGNKSSCSFVITVLDDCCNKPPVVTCPPAHYGCPGSSMDPTVTGMASAAKGHPKCDDPVITFEDDIVTQGPCMGAQVINRSWIATDPNNGLADTCMQLITLEDTIAPTLTNCPTDTTLSPNVNCDAVVFWNAPDSDDNCGAPMISSTHFSGDTFPIGQTTVTITATDSCGNKTSCSFVITVLDDCCNKAPSVFCPSPHSGCPGSSIDPGTTGMASAAKGHPKCDDPVVTFFDEVVTQGPCTGAQVIRRNWVATDPNNGLADTCMQMISLEDFEAPELQNCPTGAMATADESCMAVADWTPPTATDNCGAVAITSTHEPGDTFAVGTTTVIYTATDSCGNATTCSFDVEVDAQNIHLMCPNDTVITNPTFSFGEYVYFDPPQVVQCDPTCPDSLPGFIYMGERNGHRYFCSNFRADWRSAQRICDSLGGHLAVINDEAENDYLAGLLMGQPAYVGLNDFAIEGDFEWVNGDPLTFTNWRAGQPDNKNNYQDAVELYPDGEWEDQFYYVHNEFICEVPCVTVDQIAGPKSGEFFNCDDTEITYVVKDNNGEADTCSFTVTVDCGGFRPYCIGRGQDASDYWIKSLKLGSFFRETGNDAGYGDYTASCIDLRSGQTEQVCLGMGYSGLARNLYWRVWIDYNGDRDFEDQGERVAQGFGSWSVCGDIHVPAQMNIRTHMRVAVAYGEWPDPCGFVDQGEYEDYCVVIEDGTSLIRLLTGDQVLEQDEEVTLGEIEKDMTVFPNPAHDALQINWSGGAPVNVVILNVMGQAIWIQKEIEGNQVEVDVHNWSPGQYVIRALYPDQDIITKKIIISD